MIQNKIKLVSYILFIHFIMKYIQCISQPPTWTINHDIQAGIYAIVQQGNYTMENQKGPYVVIYDHPFTNPPQTAVAVCGMEVSQYNTYVDFLVNLADPGNLYKLSIYMRYTWMVWKTFKVSYIAVGPSVAFLQVDYMFVNTSGTIIGDGGNGQGFRVFSSSQNLNIMIDTTHNLSLMPYLCGVKIYDNQSTFSFGLIISLGDSKSIYFNASTDLYSRVNQMSSYILVYDITLGQSTKQVFLDYFFLQGSYNQLIKPIFEYLSPKNILIGISEFSFKPGLSFDLIINENEISLKVPMSSSFFLSIGFRLWSFRKRFCADPTIYYLSEMNQCFDICPDSYYGYEQNRLCKLCSQTITNCIQCKSNTTCTICINNMIPSNDSSNCTCPQSQYIQQSSYCKMCDSSCLSCQYTPFHCLSCNNSSYLSNNSCLPCIDNCKSCKDKQSFCTGCFDGYFNDLTTYSCIKCNSDCKTCNGSEYNNCLTCDQNARILNKTTNQCICNNYLPEDTVTGECKISNTTIECNVSGCVSCSNQNQCEKCKDSFILQNSKCTCLSNYYYNSTSISCHKCDQKCLTCTGPLSTQCLSCNSSLYRKLNTTTSQCSCIFTYKQQPSSNLCIKQSSNSTSSNTTTNSTTSNTTTNTTTNGNCSQFYTYNNIKGYCEQICGDGKLFQFQCDDNNTNNNDGCNNKCQIEKDFVCENGNQTNPSICSYNGTITFILKQANKQPYSNQLSVQLQLFPPNLALYSKYSSIIFNPPYLTSGISLFTIIPSSSEYSVYLNTLTLKVSYNRSINSQQKSINISFTPPIQFPTFKYTQQTQYHEVFIVANKLSLTYYQNDLYEKAKLMEEVMKYVIIAGQVLFGLCLLYRTMIGVQIIVMMQMFYLSYSMLKTAHPYYAGIIQWKYIFGWNQLIQNHIQISSSQSITNNYNILNFQPMFILNVNIMLLIIIGIYFISLLFFIISKLTQKSLSKKIYKLSIILLKQLSMGILIISVCNIITSLCIQYQNNILLSFDPQINGYIKIISLLIIVVNILLNFIFIQSSIQSSYFYKPFSKLSHIQPIILLLKYCLSTFLIYMYNYYPQQSIYIILLLSTKFIVMLLILKPFKRKIDIFRSIIVQLTILSIFGLRYISENKNINPINKQNYEENQTFMPQITILVQYGLIALSVFISYISFIWHVYRSCKPKAKVHPSNDNIRQSYQHQNQNYQQNQVNYEQYKNKKYSQNNNKYSNFTKQFNNLALFDQKKKKQSFLQFTTNNDSMFKINSKNDNSYGNIKKYLNLQGEGDISKRKLKDQSLVNVTDSIDVIDISQQ